MNSTVDNTGEKDYAGKVTAIAQKLREWQGPIVVISHVDPDGDALGSTLALKRALEALGKQVTLPMDPPGYLKFITEEGELSEPLDELPDNCLLAVLDVADEPRALGAPLTGAEYTINVDHHGTNSRFGDLSLVEPGKAATAQIVKEIIDELGVRWSAEIATPCLTGILTDTGNFRYANTNASVLAVASELMAYGIDYAYLTDRLQWRSKEYFRMLGQVMSTVDFFMSDKVVLAYVSEEMRKELGEAEDDSDDYVGLIRYAEGTKVAVFLKEREGETKV